MDRVEYEVYENDMDLTQDDTETSKEKVKSIKLMIFNRQIFTEAWGVDSKSTEREKWKNKSNQNYNYNYYHL